MSKTLAGLIALLALLAIVAGVYAAGPKYKVYCDPGHRLTHFGGQTYCHSKYGSETRGTNIRRTSAWERIWYAIVGSKDTRG